MIISRPTAVRLLVIAVSSAWVTIASAEAGSPTPSPTPRHAPEVSLKLYFRRPAKLLPWPEGKKFEIVEERPFLSLEDFAAAEVIQWQGQNVLRIRLTRNGIRKLNEASVGNIGRTIILSLNGRVRNAFETPPRKDKSRIFLSGDFSRDEAEMIANRVNRHKTPAPRSSPSPASIIIF